MSTERKETDNPRIDKLREMHNRYNKLSKKAENIGAFRKAEELARAAMRCLHEIRRLS